MNESIPCSRNPGRPEWRGSHAGAVQISTYLLLAGGLISAAPTSAANLGLIDIDCGTGGLVQITLAGAVGDTYTINPASQTTCYVTGSPGVVTWSVAGSPNPPLFDAYTGGAATIRIAAPGTTPWQASQTWGTPPRINGVVLNITAKAPETTTAAISRTMPPTAPTTATPSPWPQIIPPLLALLVLVIAGVAGIKTRRAQVARQRKTAAVGGTNNPDLKTFVIIPPAFAATKVRPLSSKSQPDKHLGTAVKARDQGNEDTTLVTPRARANRTRLGERSAVVGQSGTKTASPETSADITIGVSQPAPAASEAMTVRADLAGSRETAQVQVTNNQARIMKSTP